ncbi:MAG: Fe-S cluster assembly protein SufD [Dehalococcoidia bacterium]
MTALSTSLNEPSWLRDRRVAAFRAYEAMAMPDPRAEEWRRTDISGLDLDIALAQVGDAVTTWQAGGETPEAFARAQSLPQRFYFGSLAEGLAGHEVAVKERLNSLVLASDWKLSALQAALSQEGTLIYVPRGVDVEVPLEVILRGEGGPVFPHILIVAEENSSVTIISDVSSVDGDLQSLVSGAVEIFAAQDARVHFTERQRWGASVYSFSTIRARVERGAQVTATLIGLGGRVARTKLEADLVGEGARAELLGLSLGNGKQHFDYQTLQNHLAPHTSSDLLFKAALDGQSSNVWYGTVRIHKGASQSEASQSSRNLLLSDHAKAAPIPVLEIEAYDVLRCSHGATAGPVDPDQLFYLESRGVPPAEAESLLIEAFFHEVVDRLPVESFREQIMEDINTKIGAQG